MTPIEPEGPAVAPVRRRCEAQNAAGEPCKAPPMHGGSLCFWHDPAYATDAADAQRLGGINRRNESIVFGVHDIETLDSVAAIRRVLEIALSDSLGLARSPIRARVLIALANAAANLLQTAELEQGLRTVKDALSGRARTGSPRARK